MIISEDEYESISGEIRDIINTTCVIRQKMTAREPGKFYTWQFYLRRGLFNPQFMTKICKMFIYKIDKEIGNFDFQIAGLETASTPLLSAIPIIASQYNIDINAFSIRKNQKEYGLKNWIEGIPNKKPCLLIDDLCNSTASMKKAYDIMNYHQIKSNGYGFCIVNKVNKDSGFVINRDKYLTDDVRMLYLYDLDSFDLRGASK